MEILKTQAVLLILLGMGILGRKTALFKVTDKKTIANLLYYFLIPFLFFGKIAVLKLAEIKPVILLGSLLPVVIIMLILLLLKITRLLSLEKYLLLNLAICFGSNAFFGIPFFNNLYGEAGQEFAIISSMVLGVFGVVCLTGFFELGIKPVKQRINLIKLLTNPIILAILAGLAFSLLKIRLSIIQDAAELLGQAAGSLAIIVLGMFLYDNFNKQSLRQAMLFGLFRLLALPAATILLILFFFNTPDNHTRFLVIQGGIPAAVSIAVYAEKYDWKQDVLSGVVIITSLLSFVSLTALYFLANRLFPAG